MRLFLGSLIIILVVLTEVTVLPTILSGISIQLTLIILLLRRFVNWKPTLLWYAFLGGFLLDSLSPIALGSRSFVLTAILFVSLLLERSLKNQVYLKYIFFIIADLAYRYSLELSFSNRSFYMAALVDWAIFIIVYPIIKKLYFEIFGGSSKDVYV